MRSRSTAGPASSATARPPTGTSIGQGRGRARRAGDRQRRHPDPLRGPRAHGAHGRCASVMLGRGALIKPWLFREIKEGRDWLPTPEERFSRAVALRGAAAGALRRGRARREADDALPALAPQLLLPLRAAAGGAVRGAGPRAPAPAVAHPGAAARVSSREAAGRRAAGDPPEAGRGAAGLGLARRGPRAGAAAVRSRCRRTAPAASCGCRPPRSRGRESFGSCARPGGPAGPRSCSVPAVQWAIVQRAIVVADRGAAAASVPTVASADRRSADRRECRPSRVLTVASADPAAWRSGSVAIGQRGDRLENRRPLEGRRGSSCRRRESAFGGPGPGLERCLARRLAFGQGSADMRG